MGREFEGEAFKPTPAVVLFKDFEVGQTYRQVITLTNTSLARNAFKVSPCSHHPRHHILHTGCFSLQASCVVRASCASCDQRLGFGATQIVKKLLQHLGWVFHTVQLHGAHQVSCQLKAMAIVGIGVTDSGCCRRQSIQLHKWHQDVV